MHWKQQHTRHAFTIIEMLISILIVSSVFIGTFQVLSYIWFAKIRIIEKTQIEKEAFFASEQLIDLIKRWGTIDYEEYWNRRALWNTTFRAWYFSELSWFWNYGRGGDIWDPDNRWQEFYYCLSWDSDTDRMWTQGCLQSRNRTISSTNAQSYSWSQQRYGQYRLQYIDHNSDLGESYWETDWDFIWNENVLFLWMGPDVFNSWKDVGELYLINASWNERTFFRWKYKADPYLLEGSDCDTNNNWVKEISNDDTGCIGTIQILKLQWRDTTYNGSIDTWYIHPDFLSDWNEVIAWSNNTEKYWQNIFSNRIHVSHAEFYLYPNQNLDYAWADGRDDLQVAPYLQLRMKLEPSWKERRKIRGNIPSVDIVTTIHLTPFDIF